MDERWTQQTKSRRWELIEWIAPIWRSIMVSSYLLWTTCCVACWLLISLFVPFPRNCYELLDNPIVCTPYSALQTELSLFRCWFWFRFR
jgi:hypothetical protein